MYTKIHHCIWNMFNCFNFLWWWRWWRYYKGTKTYSFILLNHPLIIIFKIEYYDYKETHTSLQPVVKPLQRDHRDPGRRGMGWGFMGANLCPTGEGRWIWIRESSFYSWVQAHSVSFCEWERVWACVYSCAFMCLDPSMFTGCDE